MERIRLNNGNLYQVVNIIDSDGLTISFIPTGSILELYKIFSNEENTKEIKLETQNGQIMRIFNNYTEMKKISIIKNYELSENNYMDIMVVEFNQPDIIKQQIVEMQAALIELAGLIEGAE